MRHPSTVVMATVVVVALLMLAVQTTASGVGVIPVPPAAAAALQPPQQQPRFQELTSASSIAGANTQRTAATAGAAAASKAGVASSGRSGDSGRDDARVGGEWWLKDPPWFLPPPPEWGPMPPTMYTSFFHKPRYPALSTANYYPLYSREDEYDAHLPASMSRRAAHTQQLIYDHYVATYRDHMNGGPNAPLPFGDPNTGVRNPALMGHLGTDGGMAAAHSDAMQLQHPNNYVSGFSGGYPGAPSFVNGGAGGFGAGMALSGAFVELDTALDTADADADELADTADAEAEVDTDADGADAEEADSADDAENVETEVTDADITGDSDSADSSDSSDSE